MLKGKEKIINFFNIFTDFIILFLTYFISTFIRFHIFKAKMSLMDVWSFNYVFAVSVFSFIAVMIFYIFNIYDSNRKVKLDEELTKIFFALFTSLFVFVAVLYFSKIGVFSRLTVLIYFSLVLFFLSLKRMLVKIILYNFRRQGYNQKHVVVVGNGKLAKKYINSVRENNSLGFNIFGYLSKTPKIKNATCLGTFEDIDHILDANEIDEVVVALEAHEINHIKSIIDACEKYGVKLLVIPYYNDYIPAHPSIEEVGDVKLMNLRSIPLDNKFNKLIKRIFDIVFSLFIIILTSPIMLIVALLIKLSSPGPVLFRQMRVGVNKHQFIMYKFRSMKINDESHSAWSTDYDDRKTLIGSIIRKLSIDELPQFFNVLLGDMSVIGPRPEIDTFVNDFKDSIPLYMIRHLVKPGITGWAQVNGYRGDTSIVKRIEYDIWYIEHWTAALDIKILFMTVFGGMINSEKIGGKNAG